MLDFTSTNNVYTCNSKVQVIRHLAFHPIFFRFCKVLGQIHHTLNEAVQDDYWQAALAVFRKYRFRLITSPLTFSNLALLQKDRLDDIARHLVSCKEAYPHIAAYTEELLRTLKALTESPDHPLLDEIAANVSEDVIHLVVREAGLISDIEEELEGLGLFERFQIVRPSDIKRMEAVSHMVLTGPRYLYPEVMQAMRSENLHVLCYSFLRDEWEAKPAFLSTSQEHRDFPFNHIMVSTVPLDSGTDTVVAVPQAEEILDDPLLPSITLQNIADKLVSEDLGRNDLVRARLFLLEEEQSVFLEEDPDSKTLIIDLSVIADDMVSKLPVSEIESGQFILLRTEGGGDCIRPLADKLMGEKAKECRNLQQMWKKRLREKVDNYGLREISRQLQVQGSQIASLINVSNWISEQNIRTNDFRDFYAIMKLVGLEERASEIWKSMDKIDEYHLRAGQQIRRTLLELVINADLKALANHGRMEFKFSEEGGGSLTAFRVVDKTPQAIRVPSSRIGYVFGIEDRLWQG